jgi:transposase
MLPLAQRVDFVVGVDTHKYSHTAAVVTPAGGLHAQLTAPATGVGYVQLLAFARAQAPGRRLWAIEGTGSFGAGPTTALLADDEHVVEIDRPARPARRNGAKTDQLDAVRAAREALARDHLAQPRQRGEREALRVLLTTRASAVDARRRAICHVKSLVVNAPDGLRQRLQPLSTTDLLRHCARLRIAARCSAEMHATLTALRITAPRRSHCKSRRLPCRHSSRLSCSNSPQPFWPNPAWARSPPRRSCAPGRTPVASAAKPLSPCSPAWRLFQPRPVRSTAIG